MVDIQTTLQFILQAISPQPDTIKLTSRQENEITLFEISAPPENIGQIIGKEGKIIKAIRTLLSISHPNQRFSLEIKS